MSAYEKSVVVYVIEPLNGGKVCPLIMKAHCISALSDLSKEQIKTILIGAEKICDNRFRGSCYCHYEK